eukprot:Tamp_12681.p1 GENE.Tamp_12681~~Tamp_12681.p1  ORF type:complete len:395 (+),score=34.28 Tamp_12681:437-1621(+)
MLEEPLGPVHILGDLIQPFVNPRGLAVVAFFVIVGLPVCLSMATSVRVSPATYCALKVSALHFLYRISYSQVLDVMLYTVFQQRRPCACSWAGGPYQQVGSTYGMPSGDSMAGALFAAWLWDCAATSARASRTQTVTTRFAALILGTSVMLERMSWGWHSLAQTSTGASMGVLLYFWSTRAPLYMCIVETIVLLPTSFFFLFRDPARAEWAVAGVSVNGGFTNNLLAWLIWGWAFQILSVVLIARHFSALGVLTRMRSSLHTTLALLSHCQAHYQLGDTAPENGHTRGPPASELLHPRDSDAQSCVPSESVSQRGEGRGHPPPHTHTHLSHDLSADSSYAFTSGHFCDDVHGDAMEYALLTDLPTTLLVSALCASLIALQAAETHFAFIASWGL